MALKIDASYHGISWEDSHRHRGWRAQIRAGPKVYKWPLRFADPADAARVYDVMALYVKGPDAQLNFDGRAPVGITRAEIKLYLIEQEAIQPGLPEPPRFLQIPLI